MMPHPRPQRCILALPLLGMVLVALGASAASAQIGGRDSTKQAMTNAKLHGSYTMSQFLRMRLHGGILDAQLIPDFPNQVEPLRAQIEGSPATWIVRKRTLGAGPYINITRYDFDAPAEAFWSITLTIRDNYFSLYGQTGDSASGTRVRLTQSNNQINFNIQKAERGVHQQSLNGSFESIRAIQSQHPNEFRQFLVPVIKLIAGRSLLKPAAVDVYRVFDSIAADPAVVAKVEPILLGLESDSFTSREAASKKLAALGASGVLALLRRDQADLSAEARNRVAVFLSTHASIDLAEIPNARKDPDFLVECLDDEDQAIRAAALSALVKLTGKTIEFDLSLTGADRAKALDKVRRIVDAARPAPATRPATPPNPRPAVNLEKRILLR